MSSADDHAAKQALNQSWRERFANPTVKTAALRLASVSALLMLVRRS